MFVYITIITAMQDALRLYSSQEVYVIMAGNLGIHVWMPFIMKAIEVEGRA
jgi:hypothetical protein